MEDILSAHGVVTSHGVPSQPCSLKSPALETPAFLEAVTHRLAKDPSPFVGLQVLFLKRLFFSCSNISASTRQTDHPRQGKIPDGNSKTKSAAKSRASFKRGTRKGKGKRVKAKKSKKDVSEKTSHVPEVGFLKAAITQGHKYTYVICQTLAKELFKTQSKNGF